MRATGRPRAETGRPAGQGHLRAATVPATTGPATTGPAPTEPATAGGTARGEHTDSGAGGEHTDFTGSPVTASDSRLLKKSLVQLEPESEKVMASFFAILFSRHPEMRQMIPPALTEQGKRLFATLVHYAWACDRQDAVDPWLSELARAHRKFGVKERHYRLFCDALLAAVEAVGGGSWPPQVRKAWERALSHLADVMATASRACGGEPAWWLAEVTGHRLPRPGLAVLTVRTDQPLPYLPGQHVSVQVPRWPGAWREYSPANAPRQDGLLRLHVRAVPGGLVSTALAHETRPGDTLVLGPARGRMTARAASSRGIVCVAGGTGLAPVKAVIEDLLSAPDKDCHPDIRLFFGARCEADLYDLPALAQMSAACPSLTLTPVVSGEPRYRGARGPVGDVAAAHLPPGTGDVFISGPPAMVLRTAEAVRARAPGARVHCDPPPSQCPPGPASW